MSPDDETDAAPDVAPDTYRDADEVLNKLDEYLDVLDAERRMTEDARDGLAHGDLEVKNLVEALPSPKPVEAWHNDNWEEHKDELIDPTVEVPDGG